MQYLTDAHILKHHTEEEEEEPEPEPLSSTTSLAASATTAPHLFDLDTVLTQGITSHLMTVK